jgi:hypothetical protein
LNAKKGRFLCPLTRFNLTRINRKAKSYLAAGTAASTAFSVFSAFLAFLT